MQIPPSTHHSLHSEDREDDISYILEDSVKNMIGAQQCRSSSDGRVV